MFLELSQQRFKFISFKAISFEWLLEFVIGVPQLEDLLLVFLGFRIYSFDLVTVLFDQLDVITSDLIVIVFQLCKCLLMIFHELVYVQIFPLF